MCSACGVLSGSPEWIERVDHPDGIAHPSALTRLAEQQRRLRLVNLLLGTRRLRLGSFGRKLILSGPTGKTEVVDSLQHAWVAADRLASEAVDPLAPELLGELERMRRA